ncbi:MAG: PD40 domain-containing protein, partial [Verrucomicrobia bacterium]|nr:PD40 domain-containing protein [Cytophagales bacterium]
MCLCLLTSLTQAQENPLWMRYPSISPDGQSIVFSYKGDLYKVAASGGAAMPLTLHEAQDFMPVWSHDGKSIAFASDRYGNFDVFVMPATGGEAKRLTFHSANDLPSDFSTDNKQVIFSSSRNDLSANAQFPRALSQLYSVPAIGGKTSILLTTPAEWAKYSPSGKTLAFNDDKGYEDDWRKHHTSSITKDVWIVDVKTQKYTMLTDFNGEDRNPVFNGENELYYLSEKSGSYNVWKINTATANTPKQITNFSKHPVRFLSKADNGTLCMGFNGEIYTAREGSEPAKVNIQVLTDGRMNSAKIVPINGGASEMSVSPNGKEIVFVFRGEVFVTSVEGGITKRITNTPEQERSVSFSPDGKSILYAGERNNNWNVYKTSIVRKEEPYFYAATILKEEAIIATDAEEFQPDFSPDGKEVAYLEERTTLKIINLASKAVRTVLPNKHNYSYSDGDQYFQWSPDGKYLLATFNPENQYFNDEIALINADGKSEIVNLTQSGYGDNSPKWTSDGKMMLWFSDRDGMKNHGSWGGEGDVYGMFFTKEAFDKFKLAKEDYTLLKEKEEKEKKEADKAKEEAKKDDKTKKKEPEKPEVKAIKFELEGIEDRKARLTIHSSRLGDAILSKDGEKLYYLARFEGTSDLWVTELRSRETKILSKNAGFGMELSKDGKSIFVISNTGISKIDAESGKKEAVTINGEMNLSYAAEKAYIFDHTWRQVVKKFYVTDLHGVDWKFYYSEYKRFLPHLNNNYDFAEMLSEMLGELNASHTGCRFGAGQPNTDATAALGLFYDETFTGNGLKISEIIRKSPLDNAQSKVKTGHIIEKIDGIAITNDTDFYELLNRKSGKNTLLSVFDPQANNRFEESIKPISGADERELLYKRWVENRRQEVEKLSGGKVGYVHVRGMNDPSYRTVVEEVLGKHANKEALIVDTRFNGGGWLHDDLATFLGGKKYLDIMPRGEKRGYEPFKKWIKPSVVLVGESNYSDAHMFPFAYRANELGKVIGMPIPGTGTAVWWETQIDPTLVFGIPQVGMVSLDGKFLENTQLEPDIKVRNEPEILTKGRDQQVEKAVQE